MGYVEFTIKSIGCFIICKLSILHQQNLFHVYFCSRRAGCEPFTLTLSQGTGLLLWDCSVFQCFIRGGQVPCDQGEERDLLGPMGSENSSQSWGTESPSYKSS